MSFTEHARRAAAAEYGRRNVKRYARLEALKWVAAPLALLLVVAGPPVARSAGGWWGAHGGTVLTVAGIALAALALLVLARVTLRRTGGYRNRW